MKRNREKDLQKVVKQMHEASSAFYVSAVKIGNHPFIEFCGLMNEYIKMCQNALDQAIDFYGMQRA